MEFLTIRKDKRKSKGGRLTGDPYADTIMDRRPLKNRYNGAGLKDYVSKKYKSVKAWAIKHQIPISIAVGAVVALGSIAVFASNSKEHKVAEKQIKKLNKDDPTLAEDLFKLYNRDKSGERGTPEDVHRRQKELIDLYKNDKTIKDYNDRLKNEDIADKTIKEQQAIIDFYSKNKNEKPKEYIRPTDESAIAEQERLLNLYKKPIIMSSDMPHNNKERVQEERARIMEDKGKAKAHMEELFKPAPSKGQKRKNNEEDERPSQIRKHNAPEPVKPTRGQKLKRDTERIDPRHPKWARIMPEEQMYILPMPEVKMPVLPFGRKYIQPTKEEIEKEQRETEEHYKKVFERLGVPTERPKNPLLEAIRAPQALKPTIKSLFKPSTSTDILRQQLEARRRMIADDDDEGGRRAKRARKTTKLPNYEKYKRILKMTNTKATPKAYKNFLKLNGGGFSYYDKMSIPIRPNKNFEVFSM